MNDVSLLPPTTTAAVTFAAGADPVLTQVPVPTPGPGEVLIRVKAASVNPTDVMTWRRGRFATGEEVPFVGGYDVAGYIAATGRGVTTVRRGDPVAGMPRFPHPAGSFAGYITAPARHVARVPGAAPEPEGPTWAELAAIPLAALTAWQALVDTAGISSGNRVLIHAASGGVGHLAVQLAMYLGAEVTAVTSTRGRPLVDTLGAAHVVDRSEPGWSARIPPQDIVLDTVGGEVTQQSLDLAGHHGTVVALHPYAHDDLARSDHRLRRMLVEPDHAALAGVLALHHAGHLRPHIGARYELAGVGDALKHVEHSRTIGKTTIHIA